MVYDVRTERVPKSFDSVKKVGDSIDYKPRIGEVMDNIDPGHMGKVWVYIEAKGRDKNNRDNWKLASYSSPFYGTTNLENNNKGLEFCNTQQSYGMWMNPPDIGTMVLIIFVDGNPDNAWVIGYIPDAYMTHMLPGFASSEFWSEGVLNKDKLKPFKGKQLPVAEYNKKEDKIASSFKRTLKAVHMPQFEMLKEQGLIEDSLRGLTTSSSQRETPSRVFGISTPGRPLDKTAKKDPIKENFTKISKTPEKISDSELKIWNRKGGHSFVMDDGDVLEKNQLIRLRSSTGHQILLNDTDDIIYIANAKGTAWIELNKDGTDVFSTGSINLHTDKDFNFDCFGDFNVNVGGTLRIKTGTNIDLETSSYTTKSSSYSVTSGNMDFNISGNYNRKVSGITTENYGNMFRRHIEKDTFFTTGAGTDFTPSNPCPTRISAINGSCTAPSDPISISSILTKNAEGIQATSITATTGLKWAPDQSITTIVNRVPQHEPWSRLDAGLTATSSSTPSVVDQGGIPGTSTSTPDTSTSTINADTITIADVGGLSSTFLLLGTAAAGSLAPATDASLTYNAAIGALSATSFVGTLTTPAQPNITSIGTLTTLTVGQITLSGNNVSTNITNADLELRPSGTGNVSVFSDLNLNGNSLTNTVLSNTTIDNINISGNTISSIAGPNLNITPLAGQKIVLDGAISIDAGVVTGATSITSTVFVGDLTGNATTSTTAGTVTVADAGGDTTTFPLLGTAATGSLVPSTDSSLTYNATTGELSAVTLTGTLTTAAQPNVTSLGTLTTLSIDQITINGNNISTNTTNANLQLGAQGTGIVTSITKMSVDTGGSDAIADVDADEFVVASGPNNNGISILTRAGFIGGLHFSDLGGAAGRVQYDHLIDQMELYTSNTRRWYIDSAGSLFPHANNLLDIGSTTVKVREGFFVTVDATYADLAERYESDAEYEFGTVMIFGGDKEITQSVRSSDSRVAGVISENPGYKMNEGAGSDETHPYMALSGRVPCKVIGLVRKGDLMITSSYPGVAMSRASSMSWVPGTIIGKALEEYNSKGIGNIEIVVGVN